jgi:hypothetical protein
MLSSQMECTLLKNLMKIKYIISDWLPSNANHFNYLHLIPMHESLLHMISLVNDN